MYAVIGFIIGVILALIFEYRPALDYTNNQLLLWYWSRDKRVFKILYDGNI